MATYSTPFEHGPEVALFGLDQAALRLRSAVDARLRGGPEEAAAVVTSLSESLFWIAALDDRGLNDPTMPGYTAARDSAGRVVGGLAYARNFHTHELVSTSGTVERIASGRAIVTPPGETLPSGPRTPFYEIGLRWLAFDALPPPGRTEKWNRDRMYEECVAEQPITRPIEEARAWLRSTFQVA